MSAALLSRFDLLFLLLDKPDKEMDCELSRHVLALHKKRGSGNKKGSIQTTLKLLLTIKEPTNTVLVKD